MVQTERHIMYQLPLKFKYVCPTNRRSRARQTLYWFLRNVHLPKLAILPILRYDFHVYRHMTPNIIYAFKEQFARAPCLSS